MLALEVSTMSKAKTKTVTVSCSLAGGRFRAGMRFPFGSGSYDLTREQIAKVQADPFLAVSDPEQEAEAAAEQFTNELDSMSADSLYDFLQTVATAYNSKAEVGQFVRLEVVDRLEDTLDADEPEDEPGAAQNDPKKARQARGKGKTQGKAAEGREGGKEAPQAPKADAKAEAPKAAGTALPAGMPHAELFKGRTLEEVKAERDAGTLAATPGLDPVKAGEVADFLDGLEG